MIVYTQGDIKGMFAAAREEGWHPETTLGAAENGHGRAMTAAVNAGCEWNPDTISAAVESGYMNVARTALDAGCQWDPDATCTAEETWGKVWGLIYN